MDSRNNDSAVIVEAVSRINLSVESKNQDKGEMVN